MSAKCGLVSLRFRDGKTAKFTGVYTIHLVLPASILVRLEQLMSLAKRSGSKFLFGQDRAMRLTRVGKQIGIRALRRMVLRYLAWECGMPLPDLLTMSRHTKVPALSTYLGGGMYAAEEAGITCSAALALSAPFLV